MPDRKMISENELNRSLFKVVSMIEHLHEHVGKDLSYQQMTKDAMELSGCRYAAMNLFEPDSPGFRTVAIAGDRKDLALAEELLGFQIEKSIWREDPHKSALVSGSSLTVIDRLVDLTRLALPDAAAEKIQECFRLGALLILKIQKGDKYLGDFTLFLGEDDPLPDTRILEIYGDQVALVLEKHGLEKALQEKTTKLENVLKGTNAGTWEWNVQTGETTYDDRYLEIVGYTREELSPIGIHTWKNLAQPEDLIRSDEEVQKVLAGEQEYYAVECRMKHKDDRWIWVMDRGKVTEWTEDGLPLIMTGTHIDITESKELELSIREREESYRVLLETSFDIIYRIDQEGKIKYVSQAWNTLLGQSVEAVLGKPFHPFLHHGDLNRVVEFLDRVQTHKGGQQISDIRIRHSDGSWRWFEIAAAPVLDDQEQVIGYAGYARDITELKKALDSLRQQVEELDRFFSVSLDLMVISSKDGTLLKLNRAWQTTLGYELSDSVGRNIIEFIHPKDIESSKTILEKLAEEEEVHSFINRIRCMDGSYRSLEWKSHPYQDVVYASARDVTDKLRLQKNLFLEKEMFKTTLMSVGDCIISTDSQGLITLINDNAEKLTGWSKEEAHGRPLSQIFRLIREKTGEVFGDLGKMVLDQGRKIELTDLSLLQRSGELVPIEDSAAPIIDLNGEVSGVVIVFRDATDKKERLQEAEYLSFHDYLTGLYNVRYMEDAMTRMDTRRNFPFSLVAVDVNGLKLTNDAFGHETGDRLLKKTAEILKEACRSDDIVCRIGGDEFMLLLPKTSKVQAEAVKSRILRLADNALVDNSEVSLAMGIGTKNHPSQGMEDIRKQADSAMYKDKLITSKNMKIRVIKRILQNIEEHYGREHQHLERVAQISRAIGQKMGLPPQDVTRLELAASLHDVGKIILDPAILNKPGSLNYLELEQVRRHSDVGYQILKAVDDYAPLAEIVLSHHEHLDGNGYPAGLRGEEIPLLSRILAVADSFEAMTAERSYKPTRKPKEAIEELKSLAGTQYDSLVIEALETLVAERKEI